MRSLAALTCAVAVAVLAVPAVAHAEYTVAETTRPTPVSAYAGSLIWSRYDTALAAYRLMQTHASPAGAQTTALPVPPRAVPFDADIGPAADGAPTVVYSRCTTEPQLAGTALPGPAGLPVWGTGRGCDVYRYRLGAATETRDSEVSTAAASEFLPTLWRSRLGFARRYEARKGTRGVYPYVYVRGIRTERQPGGPRGASGLPGPTALDLSGTRLALTWASAGASQVRLDTVGGDHRSSDQTTTGEAGRNLLSAFVFAGRVWWVSEATDATNRYRRQRISGGAVESATIPGTRRYTIAIAPQSASSVFWAQERAPSVADAAGGCAAGSDQPPCRVAGDGFVTF